MKVTNTSSSITQKQKQEALKERKVLLETNEEQRNIALSGGDDHLGDSAEALGDKARRKQRNTIKK